MTRTWILVLIAAICALAAVAAVLTQSGTGGRHTAIGFAIAAAIATATALVPVLTDALRGARERRAMQTDQVARAALQIGGRFPRVRDITDPVTIGVHPAAPRNGNRVPGYVLRDCDEAIRTALREPGFILLVGDAAAGKSRTAFEAIQAILPGHSLVVLDPERAAEIPAVVARVCATDNCVLWLDNLQAFLTDGGITRKNIAEIKTGTGHHRVVIATMRAADEARLTGQLAGPDRPDLLIQTGQGVVEQAERVFVERLFSAAEQARASQVAASDDRIADALRYAGRDGIGEYLAWGPQLYSQWEDAWARAIQPRAAALIAAAVDCRRTGFAGPLPRALVESLHEDYLEARGGLVLSPERIADAWQWALAPRESGSAPLRPAGNDGYEVFEYLVDEYRRRHPREPAPENVVLRTLDQATAPEAGNIAATAWQDSRYELAQTAAGRQYAVVTQHAAADALDALIIRSNLTAITLAMELARNNPRQLPVAEHEYWTILTGLAAHPEADPGPLLRIRGNLATVLSKQFKFREAETEFQDALVGAAALPPEDPVALAIRANLATLLARRGELVGAEAEFSALLEICQRAQGPDHPDTAMIASNLDAVRRRLQAADGQAPSPLWLIA